MRGRGLRFPPFVFCRGPPSLHAGAAELRRGKLTRVAEVPMKSWRYLLSILVLSSIGIDAQSQTPAPLTAIRAGRLLDPEAGRILTNQIILVEGTRIRDVGPNVAIPAGAQVIDLSNMT